MEKRYLFLHLVICELPYLIIIKVHKMYDIENGQS